MKAVKGTILLHRLTGAKKTIKSTSFSNYTLKLGGLFFLLPLYRIRSEEFQKHTT